MSQTRKRRKNAEKLNRIEMKTESNRDVYPSPRLKPYFPVSVVRFKAWFPSLFLFEPWISSLNRLKRKLNRIEMKLNRVEMSTQRETGLEKVEGKNGGAMRPRRATPSRALSASIRSRRKPWSCLDSKEAFEVRVSIRRRRRRYGDAVARDSA